MAIKKEQKTILGLDISIIGTGITLISNTLNGSPISKSNYRHVFSSSIKGTLSEGEVTYKERIMREGGEFKGNLTVKGPKDESSELVFFNFILPILKKYDITHIVIEGYSMRSLGRVFDIAEFTGVIKYLLRTHYEKEIRVVPPTKLKKHVTDNGSASKESVIYNVEKTYGLKFNDDNMADSFSLAIMCSERKES